MLHRDGMRDAGHALALHAACRAEQRARRHKQNALQSACRKLRQQMRAQHARRTAAPAPARMDILPFGKNFASAVKQLALIHVDFLFAQQLN